MSITTRVGDKKTSRLLSGEEVAKDDLRLETYGTLDELMTQLGFARSLLKGSSIAKEIRELQVDLIRLAGEFACVNPEGIKWAEPTRVQHVTRLEKKMQAIESGLRLPPSFLVAGTFPASAALEVARSVARRFERRAVALAKSGAYQNDQGLIYCNRLSDYCFLLARKVEVEAGIPFDPKDA